MHVSSNPIHDIPCLLAAFQGKQALLRDASLYWLSQLKLGSSAKQQVVIGKDSFLGKGLYPDSLLGSM